MKYVGLALFGLAAGIGAGYAAFLAGAVYGSAATIAADERDLATLKEAHESAGGAFRELGMEFA